MKKESFNENWQFVFDGGTPRGVTLPHDAMLQAGRGADAPCGSAGAYFLGGRYVYTKTFKRPPAAHAVLQFEGVYKNAVVSVNGKRAGGAAYGYLPFFIELDSFLNDEENTVQVECGNEELPDSRWYTGAGIYRPVWLWTGPAEYIAPEMLRVETKSITPPTVRVSAGGVGAKIEILDGRQVLAAGTEGEDIVLPDAVLWSEDTPKLYICRAALPGGDCAQVRFGIRTVEWDSKGLYLNGKSILLKGGCLHHDSGILGAATFAESEYRRVRILKEAGFNAIRSSHNPANEALLEACDALGILVIDESWDMWFFHKSKYDYAGEWRAHYKDDLYAIVNRDYNHPCVIMYSIGNEVSEPAREEGILAAKEMVELLHEADPGRAVTGGFNLMIIASAKKGKGVYDENGGRRDESGDRKMQGMNSTLFNFITNIVGTGMNKSANGKAADEATAPVLDALDIAGYNYASGRYPKEGECHPGRLIVGSETFPQDIAKNWAMVEKYPYLIGDFMWTAWDYLGEAGLGAWGYTPDAKGFTKPYPWLLAEAGAFDLLGNPTAEVFLAQAAWGNLKAPAIAVQPVNHPGVKPIKMVWRGTNAIPGWAWKNCTGNKAVVEVYASKEAVAAELWINGQKVGRSKVKGFKAVFKIRYAPGKLEAVVFDAAGGEIGRSALESASGDIRLRIMPEKEAAGSGEIVYVPVSLCGENGVVEHNADERLEVTVQGCELLAFGSACPRTEERFDAGSYSTYYGRALAVIRMGRGPAAITITGEHCGTATAAIKTAGVAGKDT